MRSLQPWFHPYGSSNPRSPAQDNNGVIAYHTPSGQDRLNLRKIHLIYHQLK